MPQQIDDNSQPADTRKRLIPCMLTAMYIIRIIVRIHHGISGSAGDIDAILEDPAIIVDIAYPIMDMINRLLKYLDRKKDRNQAS